MSSGSHKCAWITRMNSIELIHVSTTYVVLYINLTQYKNPIWSCIVYGFALIFHNFTPFTRFPHLFPKNAILDFFLANAESFNFLKFQVRLWESTWKNKKNLDFLRARKNLGKRCGNPFPKIRKSEVWSIGWCDLIS